MLLAVYGTLRPGCGGLEHLGVAERVQHHGPCQLQGKLWLVQEPVLETEEVRLVPAFYPEEEGVVQADLLEIPEDVWGIVDEFEDFVPHDPESPYIRREIQTLQGESVWTYCAQNIKRINFLRDGDWTSYASHPRAIPLFYCQKADAEQKSQVE